MSKRSFIQCCHLSQEINNCGGWKSVEKKNEENQENKNISKDSSPDDGIVMKVKRIYYQKTRNMYISHLQVEKQNNKLEAGNDEEKKSLVSGEIK